jgi:hypothetical protein
MARRLRHGLTQILVMYLMFMLEQRQVVKMKITGMEMCHGLAAQKLLSVVLTQQKKQLRSLD